THTNTWGTVYFEYDYAGRRTRKHRTGNQSAANRDVLYFWDGDRLIGARYGTDMVWFYHDDRGVSGMNLRGNDYFFRRNILGDITHMYDRNGVEIGRYYYDAWGNTRVWSTANSRFVEHHENNRANLNPFRWRGKYMDRETGFYYMHSRFYDPMTGRFINADDPRMLFLTAPMGQSGANLFAYALNNPVMFVDRSGYFPARNPMNGSGGANLSVTMIGNQMNISGSASAVSSGSDGGFLGRPHAAGVYRARGVPGLFGSTMDIGFLYGEAIFGSGLSLMRAEAGLINFRVSFPTPSGMNAYVGVSAVMGHINVGLGASGKVYLFAVSGGGELGGVTVGLTIYVGFGASIDFSNGFKLGIGAGIGFEINIVFCWRCIFIGCC
ncbi:MAG: RHS repeat-associated core domain-containing protein, partial [Firmicutes bacterium]|nr:RHS repeat-associated core domain-containing protein [Bacillota bacterium]